MPLSEVNFEGYPALPDFSDWLPTFPNLLGTSLSADTPIDGISIAKAWLTNFSNLVSANNVDGILDLFLDAPHNLVSWRDFIALTWDFRTFRGKDDIRQLLKDRLQVVKPRNFVVRENYSGFQRPYDDLGWVQIVFDFETEIGQAFGIARVVPTSQAAVNATNPGVGDWKAWIMFTNLEDLKGHPEKIGLHRNSAPNHGLWESQRAKEVEFADSNPTVLIVGGGHSGLDAAARLKMLGISVLVIEKNERIGDNWANRYEALCLHDPVWYDHMPYLPFPPNWPVYTPAKKLANWLQHYVDAMELNVWTSSTVTKATREPDGRWRVVVKRPSGQEREFIVKYLAFGTGLHGGAWKMPTYPGTDKFNGKILHSLQHKKATDHAGKKVVVVGACTSAHDLCSDYYINGVDVTMIQRSSTYIMSVENGWGTLMASTYSERSGLNADMADRFSASFPHFTSNGLAQRMIQKIAAADKEIIDGLHKVGFRTNLGIRGSGFGLLAWTRAGGYYLDTGASRLIAEGKIKLKNDSEIECFTPTGLKFKNGSELPADVVIFATGVGTPVENVRGICGDEVVGEMSSLWGLSPEGELQGCWKNTGVKGLYYLLGNLALSRFHSKHLALQIKALEEGLLKEGDQYAFQAKGSV